MSGGKRPGAGAPKGNVNAASTGRYSRRSNHPEEFTEEEIEKYWREVKRILGNRMTPEELVEAQKYYADHMPRYVEMGIYQIENPSWARYHPDEASKQLGQKEG